MIDHYKQRFTVAAVTTRRRVKKERPSASAVRSERRNAAWRAGRPPWYSAPPFGREDQSSALPTRRRPENEGDHHLCQEGRSDPQKPARFGSSPAWRRRILTIVRRPARGRTSRMETARAWGNRRALRW